MILEKIYIIIKNSVFCGVKLLLFNVLTFIFLNKNESIINTAFGTKVKGQLKKPFENLLEYKDLSKCEMSQNFYFQWNLHRMRLKAYKMFL